jgi:inosose dehydratase
VPLTWGQFKEKAPDQWPEERVLAEIAEAGYEGVASGARKDRSAKQTIELLAKHGLRPAPGYLGGVWWDPGQRGQLVESAKRQAAFCREVGLTEVFVAPRGNDQKTATGRTRRELPGHVSPADALTKDEYRHFADALNEAGRATLAEGVRICFHNHCATFIETRQEVDALMALCDPAAVFLGPDTGHLAWAGADPVAFFRDYGARIKSVHLKDVDAAVRERGRREKWDVGRFVREGIFTELGTGCVDIPAILQVLRDVKYDGWILCEQDWTMRASALEAERINRQYLRTLGL